MAIFDTREPAGRAEAGAAVDEKRITALQRRIETLERENRWGTIIGAVVLAALSVGMVVLVRPAKLAEDMRARRFALVDRDGQVRMFLESTDDGSPTIVFLDHLQRRRLMLGLFGGDNPELVLLGTDQKARLKLGAPTDANGTISFSNRSGDERVWLGLDKSGLAGLTLSGVDGRPATALSAYGRGNGGLVFLNADGKERAGIAVNGDNSILRLTGGKTESTAQLAAAGDGIPALTLFARETGTRALFQIAPDGAPTLSMWDKKGARAILGNTRLILSKDQTVAWSAP